MQIRERRLLLVEGRDEVNLFRALIRDCLDDDPRIQVIDAGGKDKFSRNLRAIQTAAMAVPALQSIGVVRDADNDAGAAFDSVCDGLRGVNYEPPPNHGEFSNGMPAMDEPLARVGEGALQGVWDFAAPAFAPLAQFVRQLAVRPDGTP